MKPEPTPMHLTAFDDRGFESQSFLQGMLNRLGFGKVRYESTDDESNRRAEDMVLSAILSLKTALAHDKRERLIDAANYCFLAYRRMDDTGSWDGHSPGYVKDGRIVGARGVFESSNGDNFDG